MNKNSSLIKLEKYNERQMLNILLAVLMPPPYGVLESIDLGLDDWY
jgi:hypothetical protein